MEQVGNESDESETFRCEPKYFKIYFEALFYAKIYDPKAFYKAYFECVSKLSIKYEKKSYEEMKEELLYLKEKNLDFKITDMEVLLEALARDMKFD